MKPSFSSSQDLTFGPAGTNVSGRKSDQLKTDEEYARELQDEEDRNSKLSNSQRSKVNSVTKTSQSHSTSNTRVPDKEAIDFAASQKKSILSNLQDDSRIEAEKAMLAAAIRATTVQYEDDPTDSKPSTKTGDPWKIFDQPIKSSSSANPPPLPSASTKPTKFNNVSALPVKAPYVPPYSGKTIIVGPLSTSANIQTQPITNPTYAHLQPYISHQNSGVSSNTVNTNQSNYYPPQQPQQPQQFNPHSQNLANLSNQFNTDPNLSNVSMNSMSAKKPEVVGSWTNNVINPPAMNSNRLPLSSPALGVIHPSPNMNSMNVNMGQSGYQNHGQYLGNVNQGQGYGQPLTFQPSNSQTFSTGFGNTNRISNNQMSSNQMSSNQMNTNQMNTNQMSGNQLNQGMGQLSMQSNNQQPNFSNNQPMNSMNNQAYGNTPNMQSMNQQGDKYAALSNLNSNSNPLNIFLTIRLKLFKSNGPKCKYSKCPISKYEHAESEQYEFTTTSTKFAATISTAKSKSISK